MSDSNKVCLIIGASHAGVNCAFALRKEKWIGQIILLEKQPFLPYHRPPLSKTYLYGDDQEEQKPLKSESSYEKAKIDLQLNKVVTAVNTNEQKVTLQSGEDINYDHLIFATGARAFIPPIEGLDESSSAFALRTAQDAIDIRAFIDNNNPKDVVIIGGGYIGLETAASLTKLGLQVNVIERASRILARVTSPEMSSYFRDLHNHNGVKIHEDQTVNRISNDNSQSSVVCKDGTTHNADLIIIGTGIKVNLELAQDAGVAIDQGIKVDNTCKTNIDNVYAIGDCTNHPSTFYNRNVRLESVQNAVDQAKVTAANICGKEVSNDAIPWFWSDQFDLKLQMVGLQDGYTDIITRKIETTDETEKFSMWYFIDNQLIAVAAVNDSKAYVYGTKYIKCQSLVDKQLLQDATIALKSILKQN